MFQSIAKEQIILASTAKWRGQILTQLNLSHRMLPPRYSEPAFKDGNIESYVQELATGKATSLERDFPNAFIIGCDQMAVLDHEPMGKPQSINEAREQLHLLRGRTHRLVNGLTVIYKGKSITRLDEAFLTMRDLTEEEIESYLKTEEFKGSCGSYKYEGLGASLFSEVTCKDPHSITGMPVSLLIGILRDLGFSNLL